MHGAQLEGAKFECARPAIVVERDEGLSGSYSSTFRPGGDHDCTILNGAKLPYANLDRASFKGAHLTNVDLLESSVKSANFSGAMLIGASLFFASGAAVDFSYARLTAADFGNALLIGATFNSAMLQGARFAGATLTAADFADAHLQAADLSSASLTAASFRQAYLQDATLDGANIKGTSFRSASLRGASLKWVLPFRTDFADADLLETVVKLKCETWYYPDTTSYPDRPADKYDIKSDRLPAEPDYGSSSYTPTVEILASPEKLGAQEFDRQLKEQVLFGLPEDIKSRVREAFERLKPGLWTKEQDWADWAKRSASQESHDEALAARLETIACVAEGAPYVARGLLRAGRFDCNDKTQERIRAQRKRIVARLKTASDGSDPTCLGAIGLRASDFPSTPSP